MASVETMHLVTQHLANQDLICHQDPSIILYQIMQMDLQIQHTGLPDPLVQLKYRHLQPPLLR